MALFLGCDLGTLGTKVAVVDEDGALVASSFEEIQLHYPRPGWVEQDLLDIEASATRTIRAALQECGRPEDIVALAFSGQMAGIGGVGTDHTPVTHYDSWLDTRCER